MIYALLCGLLLLIIFLLFKSTDFEAKSGLKSKPKKKNKLERKKSIKTALVILAIGILVALMATGKISAVAAALGTLLILAARLLQVWILYLNVKDKGRPSSPSRQAKMTKAEAYQILGLKPNSSQEEIRKAYKDLMTKIHPDHGGNDYLAARLNEAKDILLK
jgi:cytochrome bd-type quinol oxidase subunit 2